MPESLLDKFVKHPVRERGGSRASNRLTYQTNWAFCLLLDLYTQSNDFMLVLDYHDDVVVYDSSNGKESLKFFQVKTKSGKPWKLKELLTRSKKTTHSIWGKLYAHKINFGEQVDSLNFICDGGVKVQKQGSKKEEVHELCRLSDFCWDGIKQVAIALQKEHNLDYSPLIDIETVLRKDCLSISENGTHAKGRFLEFLDNNSIPTTEVSATFRALTQELQKRSNCESVFSDTDELKKKKGFSRAEFTDLLEKMRKAGNTDAWKSFESQFTSEGMDFLKLRLWSKAWSTYLVESMDYSNTSLLKAANIVKRNVEECIKTVPLKPLFEFVQVVAKRCDSQLKALNLHFQETQIIAMTLVALNETEQPTPPSSQPSER